VCDTAKVRKIVAFLTTPEETTGMPPKKKNPSKRRSGASPVVKKPGDGFASASKVFDYLGKAPQSVKLSGAVRHPYFDADKHVVFTANGADWVGLPVSGIDSISSTGKATNGHLHPVNITYSTHSPAQYDKLSRLPTAAFTVGNANAPDQGPPPECPGIPVWVNDHWECA
jgi:hypothetical protein